MMKSLKILIITPAPRGSRKGNRVTAARWRDLLDDLGHQVTIAERYTHQVCDLFIALHARKSHRSIQAFRRLFPNKPLIVALTGTDLYNDLPRSAVARESLELADRIVLLQREGLKELTPAWRKKATIIHQSAVPSKVLTKSRKNSFDICVVGHLRSVKDPFLTARAVRSLPASSRVQVLHLGRALSDGMRLRAEKETRINPRYRWLGEQSREQTLRILSSCRLMVLSSKMEGGANTISEAIVCGVPVLASRIPGSVGLLGKKYHGYFPVGNVQALKDLVHRAENDPDFLAALKRECDALRPLFSVETERKAWKSLLSGLLPISGQHKKKGLSSRQS